MKYRFPQHWLAEVMSHQPAYKSIVLSLTPIDEDYVMELDIIIPEDQVIHLNENYGLIEVIE